MSSQDKAKKLGIIWVTHQRALYTLKRALKIPKRAIYTLKIAVYVCYIGMSSQDKAKKLGIIWGTLPSSEKEKWAPSPSAASSSGASGVLQCDAVCCRVL